MTDKPGSELPLRPCAGVVLLNGDGLVWIGRRIAKSDDATSRYKWQMPQGGIDDGEEPCAAALRELEEETGATAVEVIAESKNWYAYDLPQELIGIALKGKFRGQKLKWFVMRYLGDDADFDLSARANHRAEFDAWRWAEMNQLPDLVVPFKRSLYQSVVAEFAEFAGR